MKDTRIEGITTKELKVKVKQDALLNEQTMKVELGNIIARHYKIKDFLIELQESKGCYSQDEITELLEDILKWR